MPNSLLDVAQWARQEFSLAPLGDRRRNTRLVRVAENIAAQPSGTLPQSFNSWAELKAAYRLFDQPALTFANILTDHFTRTRAACGLPGEYLLLEDTSLLDFSAHAATQGLGVIGNGRGRGFELHTTLAVRVHRWREDQRPEGRIVGLLGQQCARPVPVPKGRSRRERLSGPRKSQRWAAVLEAAGAPPTACRWIYIADREADFYEPLESCQQLGIDFIIRSFQNRRLADGLTHLHEALQRGTVCGQASVECAARVGQAARTATLEVRVARVRLDGPWRPGGWQPPLQELMVVEARELQPPPEVEPLVWTLLTSLPCTNWNEIRRVLGRYAARWWIEEYHKAIKSGVNVEKSQLQQAHRLEALIAVLALVAARLLDAKMLARAEPHGLEAAQEIEPETLQLLEKKWGAPKAGWTNENVVVAIARLGGFLARKNDGLPGWQTIWRGWQKLTALAEGAQLHSQAHKCG